MKYFCDKFSEDSRRACEKRMTCFLSTGNLPPGPEVIKLFSSSAQLSMKFQVLINVEIVKNCGKFRFKTKKTSNLSC